jgi:biotin-dependent carboxylase-like uncharacterized protein
MIEAQVLHPGFYSSIQDNGRKYYRQLGVPHSGAMDQESMRLCNNLVGNKDDAAVIEMIAQGVSIKFEANTHFAIIGNFNQITLNGAICEAHKPIEIYAGDELQLGTIVQGHYAYLAIKDGFHTESVLGSQSQYQGITSRARLYKNDTLRYKLSKKTVRSQKIDLPKKVKEIEVYPGPEYDMLQADYRQYLHTQKHQLSPHWNRMAYTFKTGKANKLDNIKTAPVLPGTVQLTPSGELLVLMRDAQTTGGYPRIWQLADNAINHVARLQVGDTIQFRLIDYL